VKAILQDVMQEYMAKTSGKKPAARGAAAPASATAAAPPAESAEDVEKRIRAQLEREYKARQERAEPSSPDATRAQILAKAGPEEPGRPAFPLPVTVPAASSEDPLTETMAEVYLSQGHLEEALSVYENVLKREPGRADLRQKVAEVRARLALPEMPSAPPEPAPRAPEPPRLEPAAAAASSEPVRVRPRVSYV